MDLIQPRRFHPWKTLWVVAVLIAVLAYTSWRDSRAPRNPAWSGPTMGSTYTVKLADCRLSKNQLAALQADTDKLLVEINRQMSHYKPDSELSLFNRSTATGPFKVSPQFAAAARFALELHRKSNGAFDPTLAPLIDLWGFGPKGKRQSPPGDDEIQGAMKSVGGSHLAVTGNDELQKDIPELQINMSAVVAGLAADEVARLLRSKGVNNYFVDVTTELVLAGHNPDGKPWRVGIETPNSEAAPGEELEAVLSVSDAAVSTSGDYRNYFEDENGRRYSHILDARTGRPIEHSLGSVTVVAPDVMTADGLATALFVMGPDEGLKWLEQWPDTAALFIIRNPDGSYKEVASPGFEQLTGFRAK